ncbi:MAG TPA: amidohydrolase [Balneolaceae bacterium]|nr:amidohydrolase [Balneolaceae bacterium]
MPFRIDQHVQQLIELRHKLHSIAEVSGSESKTADVIADFLKKTSPDSLQTGVGGEGILATYEGRSDHPHILLRCELDALPIPDVNEVDYRSKTEGTGHKCGHDGHMSILCGAACWLQNEKPDATVTLLFQPAEETGQGAKWMMGDEKFKKLQPDYCFALHNLPGYKKHQIVVKDDVFAAASTGLTVDFKGQTSHAAHPEEGKSPALALAQFIQSISSVPQFVTAMNKSAKVTVVHAAMGELAFGTSPGKGTVSATLRAWQNETLELLKEECLQLAGGLAETYMLEVSHEWREAFSSTINSAEAVGVIKSAAEALEFEMKEKEYPFEWSEDFGRFINKIPGAMFGLGAGKDHPPLHAQDYDFPDDIISTGISMFIQIIKEVNEGK